MKIIAFFILPIIFSQTLLPTAITQNKNDNKLLILKGGSTDISGRVDTPGFDSNTWVAYYAGKPMPVTWNIIDCSDRRVKITSSGQVYWDAISSVQDITFKVSAMAKIGSESFYGETPSPIILRIKQKEWEQIYDYQFPDAQGSMFQYEEYGAFESKYTFTSSQLIESVDFSFNYFRFYINFNNVCPRLDDGTIPWEDDLGDLVITEETTFAESGDEYHFNDHVEKQKALTTNSADLDLWLKRSNDNIIITYTINGHYYSPNGFEPRTHWCSWEGGASIECLQYK